MMNEQGSRRLLLIASEPLQSVWRALLPVDWEIGVTGSVEHARLVQHVGGCDVVLLSSDRLDSNDLETSDRLFVKDGSSVVIVADRPDERVLNAVRAGAVWLPTAAAIEQPELLLAVLHQAMTQATRADPLAGSTRSQVRIDRLLELLWQATPGTVPGPWFSQRHMLERLDEEVARTQRDGAPLSVILGEVHAKGGDPLDADQAAQLHEWAALQIGKSKRRCDVAGQYGLEGFMLVLPRATPEQAKGACRRLRNVLAHPPAGLPKAHVTFGHAGIPGDRPNISGLLSRAEQRLEDSRLVAME
jgi:GGDEF domain-containing protein